ncbi:cobalamin-dependent protein [Methanococcoides orientis]|uniref:cobalamin B12-binding domain-containing protein n=1 Tax=Methanococcoides orientis TaxID=2822137 RepID=UPI001E5C1283|nr:cobalamin-dependent protein [Methanococcoides orientis]UGV41694.1 cobalamin-dependent protein [Methanococcoides orientis]
MLSKEELLGQAYESFVKIDENRVFEVIEKWFESGYDVKDLLKKFVEALTEIGRRFDEKEYFLAQLMNSASLLDKANDLIAERLAESGIKVESKGTVVIGTVRNDTHDLGKNIASSMLRIAGFNVIDLGKDLGPSEFVDAAIENKATIIAASSMTSTTMNNLREIIDLLKEKGSRDDVKVMVSGAPVTQEYADKIGADACVRTATEAVEAAEILIRCHKK